MTRVSSHVDSINKLAYAFKTVAKRDFTLNGKSYAAPASIYVSPLIFRRSWCPPMCAACCPRFSLDWIPTEDRPATLLSRLQSREIECNSTTHVIHSYLQRPNDNDTRSNRFCDNVIPDTGMCGIHERVPLSCDLPLLTFMVPTEESRPHRIIGKKFSRAWNMRRLDGQRGADCRIDDTEGGLQLGVTDVVRKFKRMKIWCTYLGIETRLDEIIAWAERGPHEDPLSLVNIIPLEDASLTSPRPGDQIRVAGVDHTVVSVRDQGDGSSVTTVMPSEGVDRESFRYEVDAVERAFATGGEATMTPSNTPDGRESVVISSARLTVGGVITAGRIDTSLLEFGPSSGDVLRMPSLRTPQLEHVSRMPQGLWFVSYRDGEDGYNVVQRIGDDEWTDVDGRTTVTHSTFLAPTHFLNYALPYPLRERSLRARLVPYSVQLIVHWGDMPMLNTRTPHWIKSLYSGPTALSGTTGYRVRIALKQASSIVDAIQKALSFFVTPIIDVDLRFEDVREMAVPYSPFDAEAGFPRLAWMEW